MLVPPVLRLFSFSVSHDPHLDARAKKGKLQGASGLVVLGVGTTILQVHILLLLCVGWKFECNCRPVSRLSPPPGVIGDKGVKMNCMIVYDMTKCI